MKRSDFTVYESFGGQYMVVQSDGVTTKIWPQRWAFREGAQSAIDELFDPEVDSHEPV